MVRTLRQGYSMALIHNVKQSLFGGVNQQAAEYRQAQQVEEMINAYPTVDRGLLKRNPSRKIELSQDIDYNSDIWSYEYSRGFAGDVDEKYIVNITSKSAMEIINVNTGKVYKEGTGLTFDSVSKDYLYPFIRSNGYAATTIKDTTFIVNKNRTPVMDPRYSAAPEDPIPATYHYTLLPLTELPTRVWEKWSSTGDASGKVRNNVEQVMYAPQKFQILQHIYTSHGMGNHKIPTTDFHMLGSSTVFIVDGQSIIVNVAGAVFTDIEDGESVNKRIRNANPTTLNEYYAKIETSLRYALDPAIYTVDRGDIYDTASSSFPSLRITKWDSTVPNVSVSLSFTPIIDPATYTSGTKSSGWKTVAQIDSVQADYLSALTAHDFVTTYIPPATDLNKDGYIWIKRSDPASVGYTYTFTITDDLDNIVSGSVTKTTTEKAAEAIATIIDANANFTAAPIGSVVKATAVNADMKSIDAGDSYGNQASFGWVREVQTSMHLPLNLGFKGSLVKVIGTSSSSFIAYWLKYEDGQWRETLDPSVKMTISPASMPHILVRNSDDTFTFREYDKWIDNKIGDEESNPLPSFVATDDNRAPVIKDIFFFKNRLGFITGRTVILSEVGKYGNFFRTTAAALLDSDRIDATVDTTKAIELEFAVYLEDSVMLFSDIQFRLQGGAVLSPSNIQISQTSAYELNRNVRPIFMNDRIFFCTKRGNHTAVMEYFVSDTVATQAEGNDITSHVQTYIPQDVIKLSGSPINNMLFIMCREELDAIYVFKYQDIDRKRIQASWFKWIFNGKLYNAFSFDKYLNLMIERKEAVYVTDWVVATGIWEGDKLWQADGTWMGDDSSIGVKNQFEQVAISPLPYDTTTFIDDAHTVENRGNVLGYSMDNTTVIANMLSREDFAIKLLADTRLVFPYSLTSGTVGIRIITSNGTEYTDVINAVDDTEFEMNIGKNVTEDIIKIEYTPEVNIQTKVIIYQPEIYQDNVVGNLLPDLDTHGWYIDGVAVSSDEAVQVIGIWTKENGDEEAGSIIPTYVALGEWVGSNGDKKETRGHLQFKTVQITSEDNSKFSLYIEDIKRNTLRRIDSKYTVGRKPMVYGQAENIRTFIVSQEPEGFVINTVSFEGNFNIRSRRK